MARGGAPGEVVRHRDLGGAVRPHRRPALPRDHRLRPLLRRGRATRSTALYIWRGGLGVWGAIALGAVGVLHRRPPHGHQAAARCSTRWRPGVLVAQAHRPLGQLVQPGALRQAHRPAVGARDRPGAPAARLPATFATFHPTFLYEFALEPRRVRRGRSGLDRRFRLGHGRVFALYVMAYTLGRGWIEMPPHRHGRSSTTSSGCGSTCGPRSCCSSLAAAYFVVCGAPAPGPRGAVVTRPADPETDRTTATVADQTSRRERPASAPLRRVIA